MSFYSVDDIKHEVGDYFVLRVKKGYEVYKCGITHATRCGIFGKEQKYLDRAIAHAERRATADRLAQQVTQQLVSVDRIPNGLPASSFRGVGSGVDDIHIKGVEPLIDSVDAAMMPVENEILPILSPHSNGPVCVASD